MSGNLGCYAKGHVNLATIWRRKLDVQVCNTGWLYTKRYDFIHRRGLFYMWRHDLHLLLPCWLH